MNDLDSPDFAKARGFLIGFSSIALVLWFFGVELTTLKVLGLEIVPKRNASHSWLLMALVNAYLCFRFYQRIPDNKCHFDDRMNKIYDEALGWFALFFYRREMKRESSKGLASLYSTLTFSRVDFVSYGYVVTCHNKLERLRSKPNANEDVPSLWEVDREYRTNLNLHCFISGSVEGKDEHQTLKMQFQKTMPVALTWMCKAFAIFRGMFVTPWFTDNWLPLVLGAAAVGVAVQRWLVISVV
ncbi:hypothetical protein N5D52_25995 [Pseudomonas sp. GD03860]|uniref:hypothetical protein n=1 Tax=Pseudomonas sp. GD03860 TaxID=2975389 RepID=UPI002449D0A0|nr:hypothetical protein [Pseudomonas sp. GD03860]MDH0640380.1 hypothetical protein [Pseudomonas sp. GD03860]